MKTITLARRADSSSTSTSSSSESASKSSSSTKATTSKCASGSSCQKSESADNSTGVVVAVVVPVVVAILALAFVLWKVWRRGKKEALEDNDPDFEGDDEFLPNFGPQYELRENGVRGMGSASNFDDLESRTPQNPFASNYMGGNASINTGLPLDPFQLPQGNDTNDLRAFARNIQSAEFDGYRLASRNASEHSLSYPESRFSRPQALNSQGRLASFTSSNSQSMGSSPVDYNQGKEQGLYNEKNSKTDQKSYSDSSRDLSPAQNAQDESFEFEKSPIKNARGDVTQGYVHSNVGLDAEKSFGDHDSFEFQDSSETRESDLASAQIQNEEIENVPANVDDDVYASKLTKEEENIKRMKSIYEVYLDRQKTMKSDRGNRDEQENAFGEQSNFENGFAAAESLPVGATSQIDSAVKREQEKDLNSKQDLDAPADMVTKANTLHVPSQYDNSKARPASSIYSEIPRISQQPGLQPVMPEQDYAQYPMQQQQMPEAQYAQQGVHPGHMQHQQGTQYGEGLQYPPVAYQQNTYPPQSVPYSYPPQAYMPNQRYHPQALENIQELPNPSNLPFSASSHSLTSFKKRGNEIRLPNGTMLNGKSFSPIDHPELFYSQNMAMEDSQSAFSQQTGAAQVLPHHLRQSVVMTNPMDLSQPTLFKPAGSFRNLSAANSRNNSMTSQHSVQQYRNQLAHQRVSGILDDHDTFQPPSVGGILPHSGSQEDLRRQLGASENYNVT